MDSNPVVRLGDGEDEIPPPVARDEERPIDPQFAQERLELRETPPNDQESRSIAKERNASAARVDARPRARTT
jgi:hypothetical protein